MTIPQAFDLGVRRHQAGLLGEAEALYRQILAAQPDHAGALHHLGIIAHQAGRHDHAIDLVGRSIVLDPNNPIAYSNLGEACRALGRLDEAIAAYRQALELKPNYPEALNNLGAVLVEAGRIDEAMAAYRRALELKPDYPAALYNLGVVLREQDRLDEAIVEYGRALELKPDFPEALNNLGAALAEQGRLDEAEAAYRRALRLQPGHLKARNNLGGSLERQGRLNEAIAEYRKALELKPEDASIHSNLVYALHFRPGRGAMEATEERRRWSRRFGEPLKRFILPHANRPAGAGRLRIGYVSPDFRDHVVGRNLLPLFRRHDPRDFEVICYSGVVKPDFMTEEFRRQAQQWRSTLGVGDEALAEMIRRDEVDILVDLTQHLAGNRLPMFARQPAPVQVSFAGYPESTGLEAIEYRISDRYLEAGVAPQEAGDTGNNEKVCFIDSFWCYDPCDADVAINMTPALQANSVTFGSLGNFAKVNDAVLKLWARVLGAVKHSHLLIWNPAGSHRQGTLEALEKEGVEARRVEFVGFCPRRAYLELYHRLDIVLDTFPYNGHTTSLDALWMGVPVVSLAGATPVSRAGLSQLSNLGLPELVAHSETEYVNIAEGLARDLPRLVELRSTLRERMEKSVLMDASRFTRQVEQAYREMWERWKSKG